MSGLQAKARLVFSCNMLGLVVNDRLNQHILFVLHCLHVCFQVTTILRSAVTKKPVSVRPTMINDRHSVPTFISSCICLQVFFAQYMKVHFFDPST